MKGQSRVTQALLALAVVLGSSAAGACSTTYQPRPSPRIGVIIRHGGALYVKDGRESPIGALGGDLSELVADRADAVRLARRARTQLAVGVPCYLVGAASVLTGILLRKPVGWAVMGAGISVGGSGLVLMGAGFTNAVDAVNVYNDAATLPPPRP